MVSIRVGTMGAKSGFEVSGSGSVELEEMV